MPEAVKPKFICDRNDGQWVIYEMTYMCGKLNSSYGNKIDSFNDKDEAYKELHKLNNQNK